MMYRNPLQNCASLAVFELDRVRFELDDLKREIATKAADPEETATLELGQLCSQFTAKLSWYEHLFTMAKTAEKNPDGDSRP